MAQRPQSTIKGILTDSIQQTSLPGGHLVLTTSYNPDLNFATVSEADGSFIFKNIPYGRYQLKMSFLGYGTTEKTVTVREPVVDLGNLLIAEKDELLSEIEIKGEVMQSELKGDTTIYNADAFKTNPDANAEDLIRKMPGVTVQNGQVQAQGEQVRRVLVDGKEFFGNDPNMALRNLPAEVIERVQVFDQLSEQSQFTGFDDGNTTKTINIITRSNSRQGQFGKVYTGYGSDGRYQMGGNINIFNGDSRLSLIGQSNNLNNQNFSTEDLLGVTGGGGGGRRGGGGPAGGSGGRSWSGRGGGGSINDFMVGQQNGITQTHAFGMNYSDEWGSKMKITGSYFFNRSDNEARQLTNQVYFNNDQLYRDSLYANSKNYNHRLNLRLEYKLDSFNSILITPRLSIQTNRGFSDLTSATSRLGNLVNNSENVALSFLEGFNFSNELLFRHRFKKAGRTFSASINTTINPQDGENELYAANRFFLNGMVDVDSINQNGALTQKGYTYGSRLNYTEPLGKNGSVQLNYDVNYQSTDSDKKTYNFVESTQAYTDLDSVLSNQFESVYVTQRAGASYRLRSGRNFLMAALNYQWANLENQQQFPMQNQTDFQFTNLLPMAILSLRFNEQRNLRLFYRTSTNPPSISQLQNVVNNSNPLRISAGNPDLEQEYSHNLFMRYQSSNTDKSSTFFVLLGGGITNNNIANSVLIAERDTVILNDIQLRQGAQFTRPVNLDGAWNIRSFVTYGKPLSFIKTNLNFNLGLNISSIPGKLNSEISHTTNYGWSGGGTLSSNISEHGDFTLTSMPGYNIARNDLQPDLDQNYFSLSNQARLNLLTKSGWMIESALAHQFYDGLTGNFDQNFMILNMGIGKKMFKDQRGELKLTVFDLLKQNNSLQRNVTNAYLEDVQVNVLQRYFMLTFTYNLRHFKIS